METRCRSAERTPNHQERQFFRGGVSKKRQEESVTAKRLGGVWPGPNRNVQRPVTTHSIACRVLHSDTAEHSSTMRFNSLAVHSGLENNRMGTNSSISDSSTDALGLA
jgi:hypothetical protein